MITTSLDRSVRLWHVPCGVDGMPCDAWKAAKVWTYQSGKLAVIACRTRVISAQGPATVCCTPLKPQCACQVAWGVAGLGGYVFALAVRSSAPLLAAIACGDCSIRIIDLGSPQVCHLEMHILCWLSCSTLSVQHHNNACLLNKLWPVLASQGDCNAFKVQGDASATGLSGAPLWHGLPDKPTSLAWHPCLPALLAVGCENGAVGVFDVEAGSSAFCAARHAAPVVSLAWHSRRPEGPSSRVDDEAEPAQFTAGEPEAAPALLSLGGDGQLLNWGALGAVAQQALKANAGGSVGAAAALPAQVERLSLWTRQPRPADGHVGPAGAAAAEQVTAMSAHPVHSVLALGRSDGHVGVWPGVEHTRRMPAYCYQHAGAVTSLQWCPAAASTVQGSGSRALPLLASAGVDGSVACSYGAGLLLCASCLLHILRCTL